jgi:hypothetical protein
MNLQTGIPSSDPDRVELICALNEVDIVEVEGDQTIAKEIVEAFETIPSFEPHITKRINGITHFSDGSKLVGKRPCDSFGSFR